jgi:hypothetical protein
MIMVEIIVVATDNATQEIKTALAIRGGIQTWHTENAEFVRPAATCNVKL